MVLAAFKEEDSGAVWDAIASSLACEHWLPLLVHAV